MQFGGCYKAITVWCTGIHMDVVTWFKPRVSRGVNILVCGGIEPANKNVRPTAVGHTRDSSKP